jgi:hypothetical protein
LRDEDDGFEDEAEAEVEGELDEGIGGRYIDRESRGGGNLGFEGEEEGEGGIGAGEERNAVEKVGIEGDGSESSENENSDSFEGDSKSSRVK